MIISFYFLEHTNLMQAVMKIEHRRPHFGFLLLRHPEYHNYFRVSEYIFVIPIPMPKNESMSVSLHDQWQSFNCGPLGYSDFHKKRKRLTVGIQLLTPLPGLLCVHRWQTDKVAAFLHVPYVKFCQPGTDNFSEKDYLKYIIFTFHPILLVIFLESLLEWCFAFHHCLSSFYCEVTASPKSEQMT